MSTNNIGMYARVDISSVPAILREVWRHNPAVNIIIKPSAHEGKALVYANNDSHRWLVERVVNKQIFKQGE